MNNNTNSNCNDNFFNIFDFETSEESENQNLKSSQDLLLMNCIEDLLKIENFNKINCDHNDACKLTCALPTAINCNQLMLDEFFNLAEYYSATATSLNTRLLCIICALISFILTRYQNRLGFVYYIINSQKNITYTPSELEFVEVILLYTKYLEYYSKLSDYQNWTVVEQVENTLECRAALYLEIKNFLLVSNNSFKDFFCNLNLLEIRQDSVDYDINCLKILYNKIFKKF